MFSLFVIYSVACLVCSDTNMITNFTVTLEVLYNQTLWLYVCKCQDELGDSLMPLRLSHKFVHFGTF